MASNRGAHNPKTILYRFYGLHTPYWKRYRRWIIHVFLIQAVPTAIFSLTVGFFALFGLPISSLGLAMIFSSAIAPTRITAIRLAPKAAPTYAKQ